MYFFRSWETAHGGRQNQSIRGFWVCRTGSAHCMWCKLPQSRASSHSSQSLWPVSSRINTRERVGGVPSPVRHKPDRQREFRTQEIRWKLWLLSSIMTWKLWFIFPGVTSGLTEEKCKSRRTKRVGMTSARTHQMAWKGDFSLLKQSDCHTDVICEIHAMIYLAVIKIYFLFHRQI